MRPPRHNTAAFTLIELVLAMSIMTILVGAMGSAVLIASHAIPDADDLSQRKAAAVEAVDRIGVDLELATTIIQADQWIVEGFVPDRGHGSDGPEYVRYVWSGTPGDPLYMRYNSLVENDVVCENVHDFSLEYDRVIRPLTHAPRVLLIVGDSQNIDPDDEARRVEIETWGFPLIVTDLSASDATLQSAIDKSDVIYISEEVSGSLPPAWIYDATIGIVNESRHINVAMSLCTNQNWVWLDSMSIVNNTHEITSVFPLGPLTIFSTQNYAVFVSGTLAPGGELLGTGNGYNLMLAVDAGAELVGGTTAPARRVSVPWGAKTFQFDVVTDDGLTLMRRAIVWAAAPVAISGATATVQVGPDASGRAVLEFPFLNLPGAP